MKIGSVRRRAPLTHSAPPLEIPEPGGTVLLQFYGVLARVETDDAEVLRRVQMDFSYFQAEPGVEGEAAYTIDARRAEPDWDALPELTAQVQTPRNHCYTQGDLTYLDYHGSALGVYDRSRNHLEVVSESVDRLHEIVYLSILSRVGELLERKGLHRVHALAMGRGDQSALFMMDSGGGKSTLGMAFLQEEPGFQMVSEDSPLVDRKGRVYPFPLRLGVLPPFPEGVEAEHIYRLDRMEFDPKYLISLDAFEGRMGKGTYTPRHLFIGRRRLGQKCVIRSVGRLEGLKALMRHMVVGVGLYQGLEFLLRSSPLDLIRGVRVFLGRGVAALRMLFRSKVHVVELGRDRAHNLETVVAFLNEQAFGEPG